MEKQLYPPGLKESVASLMHAYGDVEVPLEETVEFMCGLLYQHLDKVIDEAMKVAKIKAGEVDADCILFACRKDLTTFKFAKTKLERRRAVLETLGGDMTK
ncbi:unnamed protein product [Sphacelaria rigidula]